MTTAIVKILRAEGSSEAALISYVEKNGKESLFDIFALTTQTLAHPQTRVSTCR